MKKYKKVLSVVAMLLVAVIVFCLVSRLLEPKYATELQEGSFIGEYYDQAGNNDVIFVGDCEVYANFIPAELYREYGITSYIRGTPQQLIWQSYYIMEETFEYEIPKVVVFNVDAMRYGKPVSEAYNRLTIDNMRWSKQKVDIIRASMTEEEDFMSYVFPVLRYHSRYDELTGEDFKYFFSEKKNTFSGYQLNTAVKPVGKLPAKRVLANYQFDDICYDYLEKMVKLCKDKGVELVLVKAPSLYPYWYEQYDAQISDFANTHGLTYYNFTESIDEIGLDFQTDTFDGGMHLNQAGAVKLSRFIGKLLAEDHNIKDRRHDSTVAEIYEKKLREYDEAVKKG